MTVGEFARARSRQERLRSDIPASPAAVTVAEADPVDPGHAHVGLDVQAAAHRFDTVSVTPVSRQLLQRAPDDKPDQADPTNQPPPQTTDVPPGNAKPIEAKTDSQGSTAIQDPVITYQSYSGATVSDVAAALPVESGSIEFDFTVATQGEPATSATLKVTQTMTLPTWAERSKQCAAAQKAWDDFAAAMRAHEEGHVAIDKEQFATAHRRFVGKASSAIQTESDLLRADVKKVQDEYDTKTDHGRKGNPPTTLDLNANCADGAKKASENETPGANPEEAGVMAKSALTVGAPDDPYEQEADRVADEVMTMQVRSSPLRRVRSVQRTQIQRCACGAKVKHKDEQSPRGDEDPMCAECQAKAGKLQRKAANEQEGQAASPLVDQVLVSGGQPLPKTVRAFMEPRFGHDFSSVRIHTDETASRSAQAVSALAYTVGNQVVFANGRYNPDSTTGQKLLAHELTHVVQQQAAEPTRAMRAPDAAAPAAEDAPAKVVRLLKTALSDHSNGSRDAVLRACTEASHRLDDINKAWTENGSGGELLTAAQGLAQGVADGARVYAYLKFGQLRLADKLFFASIGAGTDNATVIRLLPEIKPHLDDVENDFSKSYSCSTKDGGFGEHYTKTSKLPDGKENHLSALLDEEADGEAERVKFKALLAFGGLRPADEIKVAIESVHILAGGIMAGLEKAAKNTVPPAKPPVEAEYNASYKENLSDRLRGELGESDQAKAKMILDGTWTPKNRIKSACEGFGTDTKEIFAALDDARVGGGLADLQQEWKNGGEIRQWIDGEWLSDDNKKRIKTILEADANSMSSFLAQLGLTTDDTKNVIKAVLERDDFQNAFATEWNDHNKTNFWKEFTADGRRGTVWGDAVVRGDATTKLDTAIAVGSEDGVVKLLAGPGMNDAKRQAIRDNAETITSLKKMDAWSKIEPLLQPKDDPRARADYLRSKFETEAMSGMGLGSASASAYAFEDEYRDLDVALGKTKDQHNLTPEEKNQIGPLIQGTEGALEAFIQTRDEIDAAAVMAAGVAAGLVATALTGGTAGPMVASALARVALAQGCANVASLWVVKGERVTGPEAMRAFAAGAAAGAASVWAAAPIEAATKGALAAGSRTVAEEVAAKQFSSVAAGTLKAVGEGAVVGSASSTIESASQQDTWKAGFAEGLERVLGDALKGAATGAAMGGTMHTAAEFIKFSLFGGAAADTAAAGGAKTDTPGAPAKLEPAHVERARMILESSPDIPFERWQQEILPGFGESQEIARQAFAQARKQMLQSLADRMNPSLRAKGVQLLVPERASFSTRAEIDVVPLHEPAPTPSDGQAAPEPKGANVDEAAAEAHKQLGTVESTAGVDVVEGPSGMVLETPELVDKAQTDKKWEIFNEYTAETHAFEVTTEGLKQCSHCDLFVKRIRERCARIEADEKAPAWTKTAANQLVAEGEALQKDWLAYDELEGEPKIPGKTRENDKTLKNMFQELMGKSDATELRMGALEVEALGSGTREAVKNLFGRPLTDVGELGAIWSEVANAGEVEALTLENSRDLFDNQRRRFWSLVRVRMPKVLTDAGAVFEGGPGTAPHISMPDGSKMQLTIDHIAERQSAPQRALDASNLRISSGRENTVLLQKINAMDPFQKPRDLQQ
jgi:hypothetical protein